jgi:microcystin-dependent protein
MFGTNVPVKFGVVWAADAAPQFNNTPIPVPSQQGITPGRASFTDGFPPVTFLPTTGGGIPPFGDDANGILNMISSWCQWLAAGAALAPTYDASFASAIGGYPAGAILQATAGGANFWFSEADNNTSNPDAGGTNWLPLSFAGSFTTGDVKLTFKTSPDAGWVMMNDGSIGNASSGATTYANAATQPLFTLLYNVIADTWAPIQTSSGAGTTRGAQGTAATAFANNCRLVLPKSLGRALSSSGIPSSGGVSKALGQNDGEQDHTLIIPEMPSHAHADAGHGHLDAGHGHADAGHGHADSGHQHPQTGGTIGASGTGVFVNATGDQVINVNTGTGFANIEAGFASIEAGFASIEAGFANIEATGGGGAHNTIQPTTYFNVMIKL